MNEFLQGNRPGGFNNTNYSYPLSAQDRLWGMMCHLSALTGLLSYIHFKTIVPLSVIVPLIIWLLKKDTVPYVDKNGRESLNFQISCLIYYFVFSFVIFFLKFIFIGFFLGFVIYPSLFFFWLILTIIAAIKTHDGHPFTYPLCIRFL